MAYEEKLRKVELPHNLIMEGREKLNISGVEDVESFDETSVVMYTSRGVLLVQGSELHIERLSLDSGEINIEGNIDGIKYEEDQGASGGFWSRLFR